MSVPKERDDPEDLSDVPRPKLTVRWVAAFAALILVWFGVPGFLAWSLGFEDAGQYGDIFGMVNALFSCLALGALFYASLLQSHELELQRKELRLQRKELSLTRRELESSAKSQASLAQSAGLQAESLLRAAELNAITARIDGYNAQLGDAARDPKKTHSSLIKKMEDERRNLFLCLDAILEEVRPGARGPQPNDSRAKTNG